jgi:hypothetical protein
LRFRPGTYESYPYSRRRYNEFATRADYGEIAGRRTLRFSGCGF